MSHYGGIELEANRFAQLKRLEATRSCLNIYDNFKEWQKNVLEIPRW